MLEPLIYFGSFHVTAGSDLGNGRYKNTPDKELTSKQDGRSMKQPRRIIFNTNVELITEERDEKDQNQVVVKKVCNSSWFSMESSNYLVTSLVST